MRRGDIVIVAMPGDFGKPRPAIIIQSDHFAELGTLTVALITRTLVDAPLLRLTVEPSEANGLRVSSQIMADKIMTIRRGRVGQMIGKLADTEFLALNRSLALFLGIA